MEITSEMAIGVVKQFFSITEEYLDKVQQITHTYKDIFKVLGLSIVVGVYDPLTQPDELVGCAVYGTKTDKTLQLLQKVEEELEICDRVIKSL